VLYVLLSVSCVIWYVLYGMCYVLCIVYCVCFVVLALVALLVFVMVTLTFTFVSLSVRSASRGRMFLGAIGCVGSFGEGEGVVDIGAGAYCVFTLFVWTFDWHCTLYYEL